MSATLPCEDSASAAQAMDPAWGNPPRRSDAGHRRRNHRPLRVERKGPGLPALLLIGATSFLLTLAAAIIFLLCFPPVT